jgi:LAO/AO transport system kinase
MDLAAGVLAGDIRAVARAISLIEDLEPEAEALVDALYPHTGQALVLGVTGSPGSGKSSLVDRLIARERRADRRVAVVAVDPSSPFTGGAILGDRLRMQSHAADSGVFIRSMATRGSLGGVAATSGDVIKVLDAAGYPTIFLETIGVGQSEVKVVELSDIVLLVLMPGAGDEIQALKAGVMEIGDIFVINKRDLEGADKLRSEVEYVLGFKSLDGSGGGLPNGGKPANPIVMTSALRDEGIEELAGAVAAYRKRLVECGGLERKRRYRAERELEGALTRRLHELLDVHIEFSRQLPGWVERLLAKEARPYALIDDQIRIFLKEAKP